VYVKSHFTATDEKARRRHRKEMFDVTGSLTFRLLAVVKRATLPKTA